MDVPFPLVVAVAAIRKLVRTDASYYYGAWWAGDPDVPRLQHQ